MEKDGGSFFTDLDAEDESVSLDDAELDRILAETEPATEGPSVLQDPDVIVLDYEDLNEDLSAPSSAADGDVLGGLDGAGSAVPESSWGAEMEAGSAEKDMFLTEGVASGEEPVAESSDGGSLPDLSDIPEPSFGGSEPSEWPEMRPDEEPLAGWGEEMSVPSSEGMAQEAEVGSAEETSSWDAVAAAEETKDEVSVFDEFHADEPSAIEEISGLPDIDAGAEQPEETSAVWEPAQPVATEEAEIAPLDLGLEPPAENGSDDDLFPEVEEIDLDQEPAAAAAVSSAAAAPEAKAEPEAGAKIEVPVSSGSFFDESDEDESVTLSADELKNILDDAVEEVEVPAAVAVRTETAPAETASEPPVPTSAGVVAAASPAVEGFEGALSRDNLKEILIYLDNLLDKLPEEEIRKFATSRYYDLYNAIFEELGLV